jgi:hypothetical protein
MAGNSKNAKGSTVKIIDINRGSATSALPQIKTHKLPRKSVIAIKPTLRPIGIARVNANILRPTATGKPLDAKAGTGNIATRSEQVLTKPLQAMAIEISGVIEIEGRTQVILKLPSESFGRYVELGDRIANDTVLVKRIEAQESLSPIIILEEVGVEVSRKVGEKPVGNNESNATPASSTK